jgi:hypothetical protein
MENCGQCHPKTILSLLFLKQAAGWAPMLDKNSATTKNENLILFVQLTAYSVRSMHQANINLFARLSHNRKLIIYEVAHRPTNEGTQLLQEELDSDKWLSPQTPHEEYI